MLLAGLALGAPVAARADAPPAQAAAVAPLQLVSRDRATVLRDGLHLRQGVKVPGFVSWQARLAPAAARGKIAAHAAGPVVTAVLTREVGVPGTSDVTLTLTAQGRKLVRARKLVRLIVTTTVMPDAGGTVTSTRSLTLSH